MQKGLRADYQAEIIQTGEGDRSDPLPAVVCIAGMHRSGTSMVARLLQACGLFLGADEELWLGNSNHPEAHWENLNFTNLNDEILARVGGAWHDPPEFTVGWEFAPQIDSLHEEAYRLVGRFRSHNKWGWKDPRNSLTLAFWRRLIPDLGVVICLRNPLEVAQSLSQRGDLTDASPFQLWTTYYRQILSVISPMGRIVTHYQSYFQDPTAEMQRVLDGIGLQVPKETIDRACALVAQGSRHHCVPTAQLFAMDAPAELLDLYQRLCNEAGPVYEQAKENEQAGATAARASAPETEPNSLRLLRVGKEA